MLEVIEPADAMKAHSNVSTEPDLTKQSSDQQPENTRMRKRFNFLTLWSLFVAGTAGVRYLFGPIN
jgi:hypothetical protein